MPSRPLGRSPRRRVLAACLLALAFAMSVMVSVGSTATPAGAQEEPIDCSEIRAERPPECPPEAPEPPPVVGPIPCELYEDNPYGPYCTILGPYFDPNSPCSPYYCGGPFIVPIVEPALIDQPFITAQLVEAIRIRESRPNQLTESELTTVAGLPASMATVEQATIGYAIDALKGSLTLRASTDNNNPLRRFPLYPPELEQATARATATRQLLSAVNAAKAAGLLTPEEFIGHNINLVVSTGLSVENVRTMFRAVDLKARIDAAHARVVLAGPAESPARVTAAEQEVAQIPDADRLGIRAIDVRRYILEPSKWGDNAEAWQRLAVRTLPNNLGFRIEAFAVQDNGRGLAKEVYKNRVAQRIARAGCGGEGTLCRDIDETTVVREVGQTNNPRRPTYGQEILTIYCREVYGITC